MKNLLTLLLIGSVLQAIGQAPQTLSFQGVLLEDATGQAVTDGNYNFFLSIYNGSDQQLWNEEHSSKTVEDGVYSLILGSEGSPLDLAFDEPYFLEITVSGGPDALPMETLPRTAITASGYELNTHLQDLADGSLSGGKVGSGISATNITTGSLSGSLVGTGISATNITAGTLSGTLVGSGLNAANITTGSMSGTRVGSGIDAANVTTGTMSGTRVGSGINASNITSGTLSSSRLHSKLQGLASTTDPGISVSSVSDNPLDLAVGQLNTSPTGATYIVFQTYITNSTLAPNNVGSITMSFGTVSYNPFTGSHYARSKEDLSHGEVVTILKNEEMIQVDGEIVYEIARSQRANDPRILGSYLDGPRGDELPNDVVMAVGNGSMWVVDNGSDLSAGDYLISSDTPGHAMKDLGQFDVAHVIARLAEDLQWSQVSEDINGKKHKKVNVLFENFDINHKADGLEKRLETLESELNEIKVLLLKSN